MRWISSRVRFNRPERGLAGHPTIPTPCLILIDLLIMASKREAEVLGVEHEEYHHSPCETERKHMGRYEEGGEENTETQRPKLSVIVSIFVSRLEVLCYLMSRLQLTHLFQHSSSASALLLIYHAASS